MTARRLVTLCILLLSAFCSAQAQDYLYATGSPVYSTQIPIDHGFVNVNNGEIHLEIPLAGKQQRGDFALDEKLVYDSRIWRIGQSGSSYGWSPSNSANNEGGWTFTGVNGEGNVTYSQLRGQTTVYNNPCTAVTVSYRYYTERDSWTWTEANGTTHLFPASTQQYDSDCTGTPPGRSQSTAYAADGSGFSIVVSNYTTPVIYDVHGTAYYPTVLGSANPSGTHTTDRNGNYLSADYQGNLVDTSGTAPILISHPGDSTYYYDVLGIGGARERYTVYSSAVYFNTAFKQSGVSESSGTFYAIKTITLPDGSAYNFTYDSGTAAGHYGELTSVTLTTGGVINFNYSIFFDSYNNKNEWLTSIVKDGGTTYLTPALITKCTSSAGCQESVTVRTPDANETLYTFNLDKAGQAAGASWIQSIKAIKGRFRADSLFVPRIAVINTATDRLGRRRPSQTP